MKINYIFSLFGLFISLITLSSCSEEEVTIQKNGGIRVEFDNIVGDKNLVLNGVTYTNKHGEDIVISKLDYYISNFKLHKKDGSTYTVPKDESYFLVKEEVKASQMISLPTIPVGEYTAIEFVVGVDSLKSTAPLQERTGVLDPGNGEGMYWSWNSGYIFLKLEGTAQLMAESKRFNYHIGFFGGYAEPTVNNIKTIKLPFETPLVVTETAVPEIHIMADILTIFDGPGGELKITETANIMGGQPAKAQQAANNYAQMFTIDHIHE